MTEERTRMANFRESALMRAAAIASVTFERRDPGAMARFLVDFGFHPLLGSGEHPRYFRAHASSRSYCVEVIPSARDAFVGFALVAESLQELESLAAAESVQLESIAEPGGGVRARLVDPDGWRVDVVHGAKPAELLPAREVPPMLNTPLKKLRINSPIRTPLSPAPVFRIGHVVLLTPDFERITTWYRRLFGLLPSDILGLADGTPVLGFFRLDRGAVPTDHHSFAFLSGPASALLHVSTETLDLESLAMGQQYLRERGWRHHWGIGRHQLGSQVFDYWKDAAGDEWEHYVDGDIFTSDHPAGYGEVSWAGIWTWGEDMPSSMRATPAPPPDAPPFVQEVFKAMSKPARPWLP